MCSSMATGPGVNSFQDGRALRSDCSGITAGVLLVQLRFSFFLGIQLGLLLLFLLAFVFASALVTHS
jgi:hypothetical protein